MGEGAQAPFSRVLHIGGYWRGPNDIVRQMMLGLRSAGYLVYEYNTDEHPDSREFDGRPVDRGGSGPVWLRWEALEAVIEQFRPDLIVCNAGGLSFRPEIAARLRKSTALLGIALSDPDVFLAGSTSEIAANFDLFLTNAPVCIPDYLAIGANAAVLPPGTNPNFFRPVPAREELRCEVLVIGRAHADRIEPVRRLFETFDTHLYGEGWEHHGLPGRGTLYEDQLLAALNSTQITVVFCRTPGGHEIVKVAVFDFIAGGALVATERIPELESLFEFGSEIVGFDGTSELISQIRYYLQNPASAREVREAGRKRVLRDYSWESVWPRVLSMVAEARAASKEPVPCGG